jgi:hypothetical protein
MHEEELWCYFYSRFIVCLKELKKTEYPWLIVPTYDDHVAVCPEFIWSMKQYLKKRNKDGFINDKVLEYPNKGYYINIDDSIQDLNTLPNPDSWTPLATLQSDGNYKKQSYVEPFFGEVSNWLLTNEWNEVWQIAENNYPSKIVFEQQVDNQLQLSTNLSNEQKIKAEIWAGSEPQKASPPTKWIILLGLVIAAKSYKLKESTALIGGICFNLLHAGITAWAVKLKYLQKRPIQAIRQQYFNQQIWSPYIQQITNGAQWLP